MNVILTPEAESDLEDAHTWYTGKAHGLGADFLRSFAACVAAIERFPDAYPIVYCDFRRAVMRRFPYSVFYTTEGDLIYIHAVFHSRRSPNAWQRRNTP